MSTDADELELALDSAAAAATETANDGKIRGNLTLSDAAPAVWRLLDMLLFDEVARDGFRLCDHGRDRLSRGDCLVWAPHTASLLCRRCHRHALAALTGHPFCSLCYHPETEAAIFAAGPVLVAAWLCTGCRTAADLPGKIGLIRAMVANAMVEAQL